MRTDGDSERCQRGQIRPGHLEARAIGDVILAGVSDLVPVSLCATGRRCATVRSSASADRVSSRAIEIAIGIAAYPNPGFRGRCIEAGSHAFARCPAESRVGVGDAEDAVFDLGDGLDAARLGDGQFHLGKSIRSAQYTERCDEEDGSSHALGLSVYSAKGFG